MTPVILSCPKISVVIPAYQAEKTLTRALDSVLAVRNIPLEVVVVDDGSVDSTAKFARAAAMADSRVRVISQENSGRSAARNRGFSEAKGEWVMFLDSDDFLLPGASSLLVTVLAAAKADLVVFGCVVQGDAKLEKWAGGNDTPSSDFDVSVCSLVAAPAAGLLSAMIDGGWDSTTPTQRHFEQNACWARLYRRATLLSLTEHLPDGWSPLPPGLRFSEDRILNLAYLKWLGEGDVEFCGFPIYCWDLSESNTVGRVGAEDARSIGTYRECLRQLLEKKLLSEADFGLLYARETVMQFRRMVLGLGTSPVPRDLLTAWQEVLSDQASMRLIAQAPRDCLGDRAVWKPAAIMLSRGWVHAAFSCYRLLFQAKSTFH